jgi:hypothetical protein
MWKTHFINVSRVFDCGKLKNVIFGMKETREYYKILWTKGGKTYGQFNIRNNKDVGKSPWQHRNKAS